MLEQKNIEHPTKLGADSILGDLFVRDAKAAEDCRTPRRCRDFEACASIRQVLDCGSPLPLFALMS